MTFSLNQQSNHIHQTYAYLRVSTALQDLEKNKAAILELANTKHLGHVQFISEQMSGTVQWRKRKIGEIIDIMQKGDALIVSELSRLARNMLEVMELLSIATQKGICVYSVKGNWVLDNSLQSKMIAFCFSLASEVERDLIASRTREALYARKLQGVKLGRPAGKIGKSKLDPYSIEIFALLKNGSTKEFVAKRYNTTPANLHHWLQTHDVKPINNLPVA